jgi:hypothetical protein
VKAVKITLGILFAAWAVGILVGGLRDPGFRMDLSAPGITSIIALVGAFLMMVCFSIWSFQSALRKPSDASKKNNEAKTGEPRAASENRPPDDG